MKRSEVNRKIQSAIGFIGSMNFRLPPFAFWSPEDWSTKGHEVDEIRDNMLGWDITDFGSGDFSKIGLMLFTVRNGSLTDKRYCKTYAEKLMVVEEGQVTPFHFHWKKMEDIINRSGGNLLIQVYNADENEDFADTPVTVSVDGTVYEVAAGAIVRLTPGESITLPTRQYHKFWGEQGRGRVLVGEVSMVNDDRTDNRFHDSAGRFPDIEEDEKPLHLLGQEYPRA